MSDTEGLGSHYWSDDGSLPTMKIEQPSTFQNIPALAERLGVKPGEGDMSIAIHVHPQGLVYSLQALITGLLDRMDEVSKRAE